jgi:phage-related protein
MEKPPRKTPLVFYRTATGVEIVRDWLRELQQADRNIIGQDLMRVQFRWPPLCRPLGDGLWEVRSNLASNRIARVLFCFIEGRLLALSGFIKKTQKTPVAEIELARKRMSEFKPRAKSNRMKKPKKKDAS